jgi:hypothetical protein
VDFIEKDALELKESYAITSFLDKVLDYQNITLYQVNKNYFENIDDYIIPLNEVLQKAYEIEKKINTNNKLYYDRKSDGHLLNLKFNSLKNEIPIKMNNINTNDELSKKSTSLSIQSSNNINNINNNNKHNVNVLNSPINKLRNNNINNNINNNNNNRVNLQGKKTLFYSTKDLGIYNFNNDLTELKKRGTLQQSNNINMQKQYLYLNNDNSNNNISNIRNNNYFFYYP